MTMQPNGNPLDIEVGETMDAAFQILRDLPDCPDSSDQLRMRIAAHNLRALAQVILIADSNPEAITANLKQVALGLLGTSDWMLKYLPELPD